MSAAAKPVDEALGYDPDAIAGRLFAAPLFRGRRTIWPIALVIAFSVIGIEMAYYYFRGWFDDVTLQMFVLSFGEVFWFDVIQSLLIGYMLVGTEMVRRGFACQLRQLNSALDQPVVPEHQILGGNQWLRYGFAVLLVVVNVPASTLVVMGQQTQIDIMHIEVMVLRLSMLMALVGLSLFDLVSMTRDMSRIVDRHVKVQLLDLSPLAPISRFALRSTMFLMIGLGIAIPMMLDGPTIVQTGAMLGGVLVCGFYVLMLPVRAARRKIRAAKQAEEARIAPQIERTLRAVSGNAAAGADLQDQVALAGLLSWRREVRETREWVLDFDTGLRILLLVSVPLGSWLGGEIAEEIIDRLVG